MRYGIHAMVLLAFFALIPASCSKKSSNAEKISQALADRLTDAMNFDDGTIVDNVPPPGSDAPEAPQIVKINAPAKLHPGVPFTVRLTTVYDKPKELDKAIVHVTKSSKHLVINASLVTCIRWLGNDPHRYPRRGYAVDRGKL